MMKLKNNIMIGAVAAICLCGCGDFLEPSSPSEFVPKDANSLNELLLGEAYPRNDISRLNIFLNLLDDDVTAAEYQVPQSGFEPDQFLAVYSWQPDMFARMEAIQLTATNMYETHYQLILGANAILDYVDEVVDEPDNINYVMAQAYALRGFMYFKLVNIFGEPVTSNPDALGVPLKLNSGIELEEGALARRTVQEVYNQVLLDLHEAEKLYEALPADKQFAQDYRTNLPMVQLLLSRVYLYLENWEQAATYADKVMKNKTFQLLDLNTISTHSENNGVYARYYPTYHSYAASPEVIWLYGDPGDMGGWTSTYLGSQNPENNGAYMHAYFQASDELMNTFDETDLRKERYIIYSSRGYGREGRGSEDDARVPQAYGKLSNSGYPIYRPASDASGRAFGRSLRLSEAYLNYAEAKAMLYKAGTDGNGATQALAALNDLRLKRFAAEDYVAFSTTDADELIQFVKDERRRELCFEDHRWYDLRRWGMKEIKHVWYDDDNTMSTYTLTEGDKGFTVPIPDEAMELNAALIQNELAPKRTPVIEEKPTEEEDTEDEYNK
ncbi:MAG: RagB/SusD family nutrient uptake outer membrane protein [Bacteroides sp.]|nr:RagB/SusD family nutrient uptake outer membrane protein [Bacteroides sp.]